jgi:hypothetical protein
LLKKGFCSEPIFEILSAPHGKAGKPGSAEARFLRKTDRKADDATDRRREFSRILNKNAKPQEKKQV